MDEAFKDVLVSKEEAIDKTILANYVKPHFKIVKETQELFPQAGFKNLGDESKVVTFLLVRKIMKLSSLIVEEGLGPTEISKATGVGLSNTKKIVLTSKFIMAESKGKYFVPNYAVVSLGDLLGK